MIKRAEVWKNSELAEIYLNDVRGAVPCAAEQIDVMMRLIGGIGRPVNRFYDLGCGDGILSAAICSAYPEARGVLIDFSDAMISHARTRMARFSDNLKFEVGDYSDSSWAERVKSLAPFDAFVSGFSIHHQPDERKKSLYREIFELLAPGGIFVNVEHILSANEWETELFQEMFIDNLFELALTKSPGITREEVSERFYNRPDKEANILAPLDLQCDWLREIGYSDADCYFKIFELAVFAGRRPRG